MLVIHRVANASLSIIALTLIPSVGSAQLTQRISLDSAGAQANGGSYSAVLSADGRYWAFSSDATNLVAGDTNSSSDIFVRDRLTGTVERVSVDSNGVQANDDSYQPSISADGRYVAFVSAASNLFPGDTSVFNDIFVHDRLLGTTKCVSVEPGGTQTNGYSTAPMISADGRYVAFQSIASTLIHNDTNHVHDIFVRDLWTNTTERVSVDSAGGEGNSYSELPSISADGRFVAFRSDASNLVGGDTNARRDIFVRDRMTGTTERVSVDSNGMQANDQSDFGAISADGRYVAFESFATNLVVGDTNAKEDVFVRDRLNGTTERVSIGSFGQGNDGSFSPAISADGRYVAFESFATNLVGGDTNGLGDVFVFDRMSATLERVSGNTGAAQANGLSRTNSVSSNGRYVAFESFATNLVVGDTNGVFDTFVRDRDVSGFTSVCDPSVNGVLACPCSNSPSGPGRGCDNSSATGGATLAASGAAYLSFDALVFTASAEKPTATSIVMQGNAFAANGLVFGQGVRCVGGSLKRLYTKTASGGSITAPDFDVPDPTVSARSATLGDPISAGQSRWYLVYYRDPTVLGGCPSGSTFNATQTGEIAWSP
jgi:Tol biopolymer transport system component